MRQRIIRRCVIATATTAMVFGFIAGASAPALATGSSSSGTVAGEEEEDKGLIEDLLDELLGDDFGS